MANIHPFQRAHQAQEYMSLDIDSLNPYNYKNLPDGFQLIKDIKIIIIILVN